MSERYDCDICGEGVSPREGKLHCVENCSTEHGDQLGFAFFAWNDSAARDPEYGHVHKRCVAEMVTKYFEKLKWGRVVVGRKSVHFTKEALARRREKAR